ncbi:Hsp20 family protein [Agrobacterium rubi]|nr:Hsp20 family protein [Agrobacterium rubi]NTF25148.1 Hsp20 family protein [Agrobacterium rubi]
MNARIVTPSALIGFDRILKLATDTIESQKASTYPPYNIVELSKTQFQVVIALAGFTPEEVEITTEEGVLTIKAEKKAEDEAVKYLHRGIAVRSFTRTFGLADLLEVRGAKFQNGLLVIDLERVVPEAQQKKVIPINGAAKVALVEAAE